jgi:DNA glycosylase AlkZ-like
LSSQPRREILSVRSLNRALLARQVLLGRRELRIADAIEHLVGIQAQEPQAPYVALWSRLDGFAPDELSELIAARRAVRGALMRATIHLVTAQDWTGLRALMSPVLARNFNSSPFAKRLTGVEVDELLAQGRELLAHKAHTRAELSQLLAARWEGVDPLSLAYAVSYLEPAVQVPPRGLWGRSGQARWTTAEAWLDQPSEHRPDAKALIDRYLAAFGPATLADIQAWSGLTGLKKVIDRHRHGLRSFQDEQGRELLDVVDGPLPDPDTPAPPRFLAPFDNAILGHSDRARIIAAPDRQLVNRDRLMRTFLVDGFVAGTWRMDGVTLHVRPIRPLGKVGLRAVTTEAQRLAAFLVPEGSAPNVCVHEPG